MALWLSPSQIDPANITLSEVQTPVFKSYKILYNGVPLLLTTHSTDELLDLTYVGDSKFSKPDTPIKTLAIELKSSVQYNIDFFNAISKIYEKTKAILGGNVDLKPPSKQSQTIGNVILFTNVTMKKQPPIYNDYVVRMNVQDIVCPALIRPVFSLSVSVTATGHKFKLSLEEALIRQRTYGGLVNTTV